MRPKRHVHCVLILVLSLFAFRSLSQDCLTTGVVGGTATAANTSVCTGGYTSLSVTGSTTGGNLGYQWESSADSTNWAAMAGATGSTFSTNQTDRFYRRKISCSNGVLAYSSGIKINSRFLTCSCTPNGYCSSTYSITNVSYSGVSNNSTCGSSANYTNYSSTVPAATAMQGTYIPISVRVGGGLASRTVDCYVDANHSGAFDPNELSVLTTLSGNNYSGYVKIPFHALTGTTMMRIIYSSASYTFVCTPAYTYSETEDYYLNITPNTTTTANGFVIHVKPTVTGGDNSGRDWDNATNNLVRAMQTAANGDTVKVARGTYYTGTGNTNGFSLHDSMALLGGYPATGNPTDADRNVATNPTILSGYVSAGSTSIPNYHVLYASGPMPACLVDGFILQNGGYYSSDNPSQNRGGGFSAENSASPTLRNCVIKNNNNYGNGVAIAVNGASPVLQNCVIERNGSPYYFPVLVEKGSSPVFQNVLAVYNSGPQLMQVDSSAVSFINSTLACNNLNGVLIDAKRQSVVNVYNSISYYNSAYSASWNNTSYDSADVRLNASTAFFKNSITQVYSQGTGLLPGYQPKFKDTASLTGPDGLYFTADDGFNLSNPCSPAINAGDNALTAGIATDIVGNPRTYEGITDLGAYEVQQNKLLVPSVVYVNVAATGGLNNGTSWANAFTDLHKALQTCSDTIKMAAGNYAPLQSPVQKAYWLDNKRIILGAYPATGNPTNADRNYSLYLTSINGNTTTTTKTDMVLQGINLDSTSVMDGITFTGIGNPDRSLKKAGVYYAGCNNPTISNCTFTAHSDLAFWGRNNRNILLRNCCFSANNVVPSSNAYDLVYIDKSSGTVFKNCVFQNNIPPTFNTASGYGLILNIESSNPTLDSCSFLQNRASVITCRNSNPVIKDCRFINNYALQNTTDLVNINSNSIVTNCVFRDSAMDVYFPTNGGIIRNVISNPVFTNCRFENGKASYGGTVYNDSSTAQFTKCVFSNCTQPFYNTNSSNPVFSNCIATGSKGTFMINQRSRPALYHCSIVNGNSSTTGVISNDNTSAPEINNCIFWKNYQGATADTTFLNSRRDVVSTGSGQSVIRNSMFEFLDAGVANGNIGRKDPRFINFANPIGPDSLWFTADDGLRLCDCSPAINSGNNMYSLAFTDIADMPRPFGTNLDRGAYELQTIPAASQPNTFYVNAGASGANTGENWSNAYAGLQPALRNPCADTIKLAAGTYKPALQNRDSLFAINRSIVLMGSYNPSNPNTPRDVDMNPTILSGDIGVPNDTADNSRRLLVAYYVDTLRIDGLVFRDVNSVTATAGSLNMLDAQYVLNLDISNSRFYKNYTKSSTLYMYLVSKYNIRKSVFSQNKSLNGGGIWMNPNGYSKKITDCIFNKNEASNVGGGVDCSESGVVFVNCLFNNNVAILGGGMYVENNRDIQVTNCTFSDNKVTWNLSSAGAGIHSAGASYQGGGAGPYIRNCIFTTNSKFGTNDQNCYYDVYYNKNGYPPSNCQVEVRIDYSAVTTQPYSYSGDNNIAPTGIVYKNAANAIGPDNRWFTADDGLQLNVCSDGINKGYNAANTATIDLAGIPRIISGTIDLGPYEFSGVPDGIQLLTTANDSLTANKEITDADGWTHYYKDCYYLMSVKKAGQDIGIVGDGVFSVQVKTLPAYGSNTPTDLSAAAYISPGVSWKVMNRYWRINATRQLTDSLQVRFPFTATDYRDVSSANPAITTPRQLVFYKTDGATAPTSVTLTAANFNKYLYATSPSKQGWVLTVNDTATYTASYHIRTLKGGGGGGIIDTTCVSNTSTWLGITAEWSNPANWSAGQVPTVCTYAIVNVGVPNMPEVNVPNAACYQLTLNPGTTITIRNSGNLSIIGP